MLGDTSTCWGLWVNIYTYFLSEQVHSILFPNEGQELGYTTLIDNIKHTELQASLKRLYNSQETVMHLVAHDVRNPLANIKLAVELLRRDLASDTQGRETPKFLAIIEQAAVQAEAILRDVLYIGELDAGQLHKRPWLKVWSKSRICQLVVVFPVREVHHLLSEAPVGSETMGQLL